MAVTSDLLSHMEDIDDLLSNADVSGTSGVPQTRAVRALNRAQDLLESFIAMEPDLLASVDDTVSQTVGQEYSSTPSRTLRIDSLWFLDASDSLPRYEIQPVRNPGGHRMQRPIPIFDVSADATGRPEGYWWARGSDRVYWDRQPDTTNSIRFIGFFGAADMTISPDSTFAYDDSLILPVAQVASEIFRFRRRDDWREVRQYAMATFQPVVSSMKRAWRHGLGDIRGVFPAW